jgi:hypothetical protein
MAFVPDNFVPDASQHTPYFKPSDNARVRILRGSDHPQHFVMYYMAWERSDEGSAPVRFPCTPEGKLEARKLAGVSRQYELTKLKRGLDARFLTQAEYDKGVRKAEKEDAKQCWACMAYSYKDERVMIWEIKSPLLMNGILDLVRGNPDKSVEKEGDPWNYDIKIKIETENPSNYYSVTAVNPSDLNPLWIEELENMNVDVRALLSGDNPINFTAPTDPPPDPQGFQHTPPPDSPEQHAREDRVRRRVSPSRQKKKDPQTLLSEYHAKLEDVETTQQFNELGGIKGLESVLNKLIADTDGQLSDGDLQDAQEAKEILVKFFTSPIKDDADFSG